MVRKQSGEARSESYKLGHIEFKLIQMVEKRLSLEQSNDDMRSLLKQVEKKLD